MVENIISRRERKKEAMKQLIIETALNLFRKSSVEETTMEQIAEAADIAKGTLYNYFPSKEAIIGEYVKREVKKIEKEFIKKIKELSNVEQRLLAFFQTMFTIINENIDILKPHVIHRLQNYFDTLRNEEIRSGAKGFLRQIIILSQEQGELRRDISVEYLANFIEFNMYLQFVTFYEQNSFKTLEEKQVKIIIDLFLNGSKAREED